MLDTGYQYKYDNFKEVDNKINNNFRYERALSEDLHEHTSGELNRALSWPLLSTPRPSTPEANTPVPEVKAPRRFVLRTAGRLWQHYYPEGGWGWVIILCSVLVHILTHGLQLSFSVMILPMQNKFQITHIQAGKCYTLYYVINNIFVSFFFLIIICTNNE
jgi:hypothetical protein